MQSCQKNKDWCTNNRLPGNRWPYGPEKGPAVCLRTQYRWSFTMRAARIFALIAFLIVLHPQLLRAASFQLPQLPQIPGLSGKSADWRQWDSFFTFVVKRFGQELPENLKDPLAGAFLDSRYELTSAIAPG